MANESDVEFIVELWESFSHLIPSGKRETAAVNFLKKIEDGGYDVSRELEGNDQYLDEALNVLLDGSYEDDEDSLEEDD